MASSHSQRADETAELLELMPWRNSRASVVSLETFDAQILATAESREPLITQAGDTEGPSRTTSDTLPALPASRKKTKRFSGWRFGVACSAGASAAVLFINLGLIIAASSLWAKTTEGGIGTLMYDECGVVDSWSIVLHLVINGLSATLLGASNYTMQCLAAPTRQDVDEAHEDDEWLDIGVPSIRNILIGVARSRAVAWCLLALSSTPIHLVYNSALFKTTELKAYGVIVAQEGFLDGTSFEADLLAWNRSGLPNEVRGANMGAYPAIRDIQVFFSESMVNRHGLIQNVTGEDCIRAYQRSNVGSDRGHVLLITHNTTDQNTSFWSWTTVREWNAGNWLCLGTERLNAYSEPGSDMPSCLPQQIDDSMSQARATRWIIDGKEIAYCLSQLRKPRCKLQFSMQMLVTVAVCNAVKTVIMLWAVFSQKDVTLVTVGDAVSSFLDRPDTHTKDRCWMNKEDARQILSLGPSSATQSPATAPGRLFQRRRWHTAAGQERWVACLLLCVSSVIAASGLLGWRVHLAPSSSFTSRPFAQGFGQLDADSFMKNSQSQLGTSGLVGAAVTANTPQAVLSCVYFVYNSLFTSMLSAAEWSHYYLRKKPLRVSTPHGQQRSTYWLQLPLRYSLPLIGASTLLHWLISQGVFLSRISTESDDLSQISFSALPILLAILLGLALICFALVFGFKEITGHMPVAGSCSLAIAAACHRPDDDKDAAFLPVSWGALTQDPREPMGHCCFTSLETHEIIPGRAYA